MSSGQVEIPSSTGPRASPMTTTAPHKIKGKPKPGRRDRTRGTRHQAHVHALVVACPPTWFSPPPTRSNQATHPNSPKAPNTQHSFAYSFAYSYAGPAPILHHVRTRTVFSLCNLLHPDSPSTSPANPPIHRPIHHPTAMTTNKLTWAHSTLAHAHPGSPRGRTRWRGYPG
jgi:hypothetical protein